MFRTFNTFLIWPCLLINQVFSDQIKTIDGNTIEGEIIDADEEYLTVHQIRLMGLMGVRSLILLLKT